jgi:ADP-ribosylglycohydrolase
MTNTENVQIDQNRFAGAVWGLACGDAYGDPIEFAHPPMDGKGPVAPARFRVTDDTQMSIYVMKAIEAWDGEHLGLLRQELAVEFDTWYDEQATGWARAPGNTCMSALAKLSRMGLGGWQQATSHTSAGCGSVMRAAWVGLSDKVSDEQLFTVAAMQAVLTHGPAENAFAAAALASLTREIARGNVAPGGAVGFLSEWADAHEDMAYDSIGLGSILWKLVVESDDQSKHHESPEDYVREGIEHVRWIAMAAGDLTAALKTRELFTFDPADYSGQGWRAREAVAMAVGVFDADLGFVDSIRAAAWTRGDSDSTAAITGALAGAYDPAGIPGDWFHRIEDRYQRELTEIVWTGVRG